MFNQAQEQQKLPTILKNEEDLPQQEQNEAELLKEFGATAPLPVPQQTDVPEHDKTVNQMKMTGQNTK